MGFVPVFLLFVTFFCCPQITAMTSTLPIAEFFLCSVHVKASQVELQCPEASVVWLLSAVSDAHSYHTHGALTFPLLLLLAQTTPCFCGVTLLRSLLARNPVFVQSCLLCLPPVTLLQDTHPLSLWEHAAGHLKALSGCKLPQLELWQISQGTTEYDSRDPE